MMKIGLLQINTTFDGSEYLPYSVALLESYARQRARSPRDLEFLPALYARQPVDAIVERLRDADVAGFSIYVWNVRISLAVAERLKRLRPGVLIVCGGPQVPDRAEAFLRQHRFIDVVTHGEAEQTFVEILDRYPDRDWRGIAGVSYLDADGAFVHGAARPRFRDLSGVPSPFLEGVFEPLFAASPRQVWRATWETNRGCPFECTFCDWGSAVGSKVSRFDMERLLREGDWFSEKKINFIFVADANFGILPRDVEIVGYIADLARRKGYPKTFSTQNTKNQTDRAYETQRIIMEAGLSEEVCLSIQTTSDDVLKAIKRENISLATYSELQTRFLRDGYKTYTDMILGLPGETYESFVESISNVIENGQHSRMQFHNLSILPNAEMGDPEYGARYALQTVETEIINNHGPRLAYADGIVERQQLVIGTSTMPPAAWRRARTFAWMTSLLFFNRLLHVPLLVLHAASGKRFGELIGPFVDVRSDAYPELARLRDACEAFAAAIQKGGLEYMFSEQWLGGYWTVDEYLFIELCLGENWAPFYREAERLLRETGDGAVPAALVHDAVALNAAMLLRPRGAGSAVIDCGHDVLELYQAAMRLERIHPQPAAARYRIEHDRVGLDEQKWCREVVRDRTREKLSPAVLESRPAAGADLPARF